MEITGKLLRIEKLEQITEKFKKKRLIIEYSKNEKYPQILEFTLTQNNIALADVLNQGDEIKLLFDFKGKEFIDKNGITRVFNTLDVYKIEIVKKSIDFIETPSENSNIVYENNTEDLPF